MKIYTILSVSIIVLFLASCENEIPFNIKENSPKLVVNAIIDCNNEVNYIYLSKTGKESTSPVNEATINIYINDELVDQITKPVTPDTVFYQQDSSIYYTFYTRDTRSVKYKTDLRFFPGDKVKIEVYDENDKYHAWVEDVVPKPLEIENIDTMTFTKEYDMPYMRLKTTFTDFPNEKNYYRLYLTQKNSLHMKATEEGVEDPDLFFEYEEAKYMDTSRDVILNNRRVITDDEIFPQVENIYAVFDDSQLNEAYAMTTIFSRPEKNFYNSGGSSIIERVSVEYKIHLISITEMQYYYLKALNITSSQSYDEYLSMPVAYPSNVNGGVGLVGFSAGTHKTFSIPDFIPYTGYGGGYYPK